MSKWGRLGIFMCLFLATQVWASIGKVSLLKGEAIANRNNQTISLANGTTLEEHDIITTRANSQIQLTFEDKTVITLGSESVLDIKEYLNDAQDPKAKFKFSQGTFKSITGQIGKKAPENFNLETKTATIGIRGTTVVGQIGQGEAPDIIGCSSGRIVVSNAGATVAVNAGFQTTVSKTQAPTPAVVLTPALLMSSQPAPSAPLATHTPSSDALPPLSAEQVSTQTASVSQPIQATATDAGPAHQIVSSNTAQTVSVSQPIQTTATDAGLAHQIVSSNTAQVTQTNQQVLATANIATQINDIEDADVADTVNEVLSASSHFYYPTFNNPRLQASSRNVGTVNLSGFATSSYTSNGETRSSINDTFMLSIQSGTNSLSDTYSYITLDRIGSLVIDLAKSSDASTMTYKKLNRFAIKDFDNYQGWIITKNTYANDYVSWGYWAINLNDDSKLLASANYWVAGLNSDSANSHINTLIAKNHTTTYSYNGHVIGSVSDGTNSYNIDPTRNNDVKLNFDFGGGNGTLKNTSYIKFQTSQSTPELWKITPSGTVGSGSFSISNIANVAVNSITDSTSTSIINGQFYGTSAQATGGTFSATSGSNTATGVFKATR
ncbi:FecR domain-containing protein [Sulfurospirillum oryzae]|uniref:FecR domain-containing protein n=1 Tax=Sulfurospirillum oryzae TaxID=2976535 RepID=UPI0021E7ECD5|nr:FecR domain-containing protein [Sulfurospirillum oryzae]